MSTVATLTVNPTVDASTQVERVVAEDKLRCAEPTYEPGGGGLNVARVVQALGEDALALWTCGGPLGRLLGDCLDAGGLRHRPIPIEGMTRQNLIVFEETSGQQYRFGFPGPALTHEEVVRCAEAVQAIDPAPRVLVLSGSLPPGVDPEFYARVAGEAPRDTKVVVDTSGEALRRSLEARPCLVKPNLRELGQLVGKELTSDAEIERAAMSLVRDDRVEVVIVSLGAAGALVATQDGPTRLRSPMVPIRSKVGAGDSMVAGAVVGLARGWSWLDAARLGVAAGAAAVMTEGTQLARPSDVERLFAETAA